jgi:hypothetical protein
MHRRFLAALTIAALAAACSRDLVSSPDGGDNPVGAAAPGSGPDTAVTGTPSTPTPPEPTSNGPVASLELSPKTLTLSVGYYGHIDAAPRDANGVRVANKRATWTSDDPSIVVASDTGIMYAKAIGTTTVRATVDGFTASATITVTAATTPPPPPNPEPSQPPVASFDLEATVYGALAGADTSRKEIVAGAIVHLMRVGSIEGDTLLTAVDAGTATTDAQGVASFTGLPGGFYTVDITPPAGSPYAALRSGIGAPDVPDVHTSFVLRRR